MRVGNASFPSVRWVVAASVIAKSLRTIADRMTVSGSRWSSTLTPKSALWFRRSRGSLRNCDEALLVRSRRSPCALLAHHRRRRLRLLLRRRRRDREGDPGIPARGPVLLAEFLVSLDVQIALKVLVDRDDVADLRAGAEHA